MIHECFILKVFSANKAEGHWSGRIGPLHDTSFSISHMKFWIDVLVVTALQSNLLCLEIPPFSLHLEIPSSRVLVRCLMVWSWIGRIEMWGNPFLLQHGRNWERLLTDNEVEVAWERVGELQGKSIPAGFMGFPICCGGGTGCRCPGAVCVVLGHPQPMPPTANSSRIRPPCWVVM